MRSLFKNSSTPKAGAPRVPRHSSGWGDLLKHLQANESLRILDVGATSPHNINFLTGLGHSVYMANFVEDAARSEFRVAAEAPEPGAPATRFDIETFLKTNLDFAGRHFDVITLWDAADYLPPELVSPLVERLHQVLAPGGKLLGFFHTKMNAPDTTFSRYHLTGENQVEIQRLGTYPLVQTFQTRQIERLFKDYSNYRFFLAKDSVQEVIVTR